jgi:hypothetical protein
MPVVEARCSNKNIEDAFYFPAQVAKFFFPAKTGRREGITRRFRGKISLTIKGKGR